MLRLSLAVLLTLPAVAVPQDDPVKKQKEAAAENIKLAKLDKLTAAETDAILLYTTLPEAKAKTLAATGQKAFESATKLLKATDPGKLWAGKLTAYVLPVRANYNSFIRLVMKERPETVESHRADSKGDAPFVLVGVEPGTMMTDAGLAEELGQAVATTALARFYGTRTTVTELPYWLTDGFGKVATARADGNAAKLTALRTRQRAVFGRKTVGSFKVGNVWGTDRVKDQDVLAASFVEFLLFAPEPKFDKFTSAFKPGEGANRPVPTSAALDAVEWKDDAMLDNAWKTWVVKTVAK